MKQKNYEFYVRLDNRFNWVERLDFSEIFVKKQTKLDYILFNRPELFLIFSAMNRIFMC